MHDAIVTNGRLRPGEAVLIQGASTGVGILGLQIARMKNAGLVIAANEAEASAHDMLLAELDKACGGRTIWRTLVA